MNGGRAFDNSRRMKRLEKLDVGELIFTFTGQEAMGTSMQSYLDLETGELLQVFDFDAELVGDDAVEESRELNERIEREPARYARVPVLETQEEYLLMERFAESLPDEEDRTDLQRALQGKGAFRRFKDAAHRIGKRDDWFAFQEAEVERLARRWLSGLGLEAPPRVRPPPPVQPPAPIQPSLVDLLLFGGAAALEDGRVRRVLVAPTTEKARAWFRVLARSICDHVGDEWRKRFVENTDLFERGRFTLRVSGTQLELFVAVDPKVHALF